jgi:hypothetical protein
MIREGRTLVLGHVGHRVLSRHTGSLLILPVGVGQTLFVYRGVLLSYPPREYTPGKEFSVFYVKHLRARQTPRPKADGSPALVFGVRHALEFAGLRWARATSPAWRSGLTDSIVSAVAAGPLGGPTSAFLPDYLSKRVVEVGDFAHSQASGSTLGSTTREGCRAARDPRRLGVQLRRANCFPGEETARGHRPAIIPVWERSAVSVRGPRPRLGQVASECADGLGRQEAMAPRMRPDAAIPDLEAMLADEILDALDGAAEPERHFAVGQVQRAECLLQRGAALSVLVERPLASRAALHRQDPTARGAVAVQGAG